MRRERQCPKCGGRTRVRTSYRDRSRQVQLVECVACGHELPRIVHPDDIARRPTPRKNRRKLQRNPPTRIDPDTP